MDFEADYEAQMDKADLDRKADKENGPRKLPLFDSGSPEASKEISDMFSGEKLTPLNEAARRNLAKHVCMNYTIRDGKPVCAYCGKEMEL